ncbi:MAG: hypothetical protein WC242_05455 [Candidatus Paceibacterota bacterium]|jgi:hypothetical protein
MAKKKVTRQVEVTECDFCGVEDKNCSRCVLCGKYACTKRGGSEHIAFSVSVFDYATNERTETAHICKECTGTKPDLTVGQLLKKILHWVPM